MTKTEERKKKMSHKQQDPGLGWGFPNATNKLIMFTFADEMRKRFWFTDLIIKVIKKNRF